MIENFENDSQEKGGIGGCGGPGLPGTSITSGPTGYHPTDDSNLNSSATTSSSCYPPGGVWESKEQSTDVEQLLDATYNVDIFSYNMMMREFHGHTGGIGSIPESFEDVKKSTPPAAMKRTMENSLAEMSEKELLVEFGKQNAKLTSFLGKANAGGAVLAIRMGMIINHLKMLHATMDDWVQWSKKNIIDVYKVSKRTLEKYSNIHLLPNVEQHPHLGIELLAEFGSVYKRSDSEMKKLMGDDPIKHYIVKLAANATADERKTHLEAVIEILKLERFNINVDLELMKSFLEVEGKLSKDRRKFLAIGQEKDPEFTSKFLKLVIEHNGNWTKAEEAFAPKATKESSVASDNSDKPVPPKKDFPNIVEQATSLNQTINAMLQSNMIAPDVSAEMLDELVDTISKLKNRIAPQVPAA